MAEAPEGLRFRVAGSYSDDGSRARAQTQALRLRAKTFQDGEASAAWRAERVVTPGALAEMHQLHEQLRRQLPGPGSPGCKELPDAALDAVWGTGGTWHVSGALPRGLLGSGGSEKPFAVRRLRLRPRAWEPAEALLQRCGVGAVNLKGLKGPGDRSLGQDNLAVARLDGGWEFFCVMDGHGPDGHWPSTRAVQTCPVFLQSGECAAMICEGRVEAALAHCFAQVQEDLHRNAWPASAPRPVANLPFSGCAAVCALRHPARGLWLAHCGDSRAVLLVPGRGAERETRDHKPSVPSERRRLEALGCEVQVEEHEDGCREERVFLKGQPYPGLMMSRSLGDLVVKASGVTATPEVAHWPLEACRGARLLLATDGVWELLASQEVAELVLGALARGSSCQAALEELLATARDAWADADAGYCDDITAVLLPLDGPVTLPLGERAGCAAGCAAAARRACCGA